MWLKSLFGWDEEVPKKDLGYLSKHFQLSEFTVSQTAKRLGIKNNPSPRVVDNLRRLCVVLEEVRRQLNIDNLLTTYPIVITSGFRSKKLNEAVGGSSRSQHIDGLAVDFYVPGKDLDEVMNLIYKGGIEYDQLIKEFDGWIHLSIANVGETPRQEALVIDNQGTRLYS